MGVFLARPQSTEDIIKNVLINVSESMEGEDKLE